MTSRLDRLFILLESGSSAVTRRAAAKQIGEVQKLHPHELHNLLSRLVVYLHSASWDTRIAAAQAVDAILSNVPAWSPEPVTGDDPTADDSEAAAAAAAANEARLTFAGFDVRNVLRRGARLMGSEGSEFDRLDEHEADSREHLMQQRAALNEKLGFSNGSTLGININDLVTLDDMRLHPVRESTPPTTTTTGMDAADEQYGGVGGESSHSSSSSTTTTNTQHNQRLMPVQEILRQSAAAAAAADAVDALSCREMNRAKRKARQVPSTAATVGTATASNGASGLSRSNSTGLANGDGSRSAGSDGESANKYFRREIKSEQPSGATRITSADAVPDGTGSWEYSVEWPLDAFCSRLYLDLFNARWETRHGAATALRELLKSHASGAGKTAGQTADQMAASHRRWQEDAVLRLLCVLALDRFGDFVSDQVVAPVRETCAQVLGAILKDLPEAGVRSTVGILLSLVHQPEWEVRHGGLLGIKYMLVVREDLLPAMLPVTIDQILAGLFDAVDDVGAVAATTLIPIAAWLPRLLTAAQVSAIVKMLWDLLLDQDELTSACNSFMGLLSAIVSLKDASKWMQMEPMDVLIPRLWPFLSHNTSTVRRSTLQTLKTLTEITTTNFSISAIIAADGCSSNGGSTIGGGLPAAQPAVQLQNDALNRVIQAAAADRQQLELNIGVKHWSAALLQDAMRHIYQRVLVEHMADIQQLADAVWTNLVTHAELSGLLHAACPFVASWMCLAMQPARLAFDPTQLIVANVLVRERRPPKANDMDVATAAVANQPGAARVHQKMYLGGIETTPADVRERNVPRARCKAARMLGLLSRYLVLPAPGVQYTTAIESPINCYAKILMGYLESRSALQRLIGGMIIANWAHYDPAMVPGPPQLQQRLNQSLLEYFYYDEVAVSLTRLLQEARDLLATMKLNRVTVDESLDATAILTLDQIQLLATTLTADLRQRFALKPKVADMLDERRRSLQQSFAQTSAEQSRVNVSTQAVLAGAAVQMGCLPDKLNPVIKPIMESLKREECEILQQQSAQYLVRLLDQVAGRKTCPNNKIVTNLCTLLRSDAEFTPNTPQEEMTFTKDTANTSNNPFYGILTLDNQQKLKVAPHSNSSNNNGATPTANRGPGRPPANSNSGSPHASTSYAVVACTAASAATDDSAIAAAAAAAVVSDHCEQLKQLTTKMNRIQRIGATYAVREICSYFGAELHTRLPVLWTILDNIRQLVPSDALLLHSIDPSTVYDLITALQLCEVMAPHVHADQHDRLFALLPSLVSLLRHPLRTVRHMSSRCLATLATLDAARVMPAIVDRGLTLLQSIHRVIDRQGAAEAIACIVAALQFRIVPYVVLLVVPLLGRMSDPDQAVRLMSTHSFATLIQLMPLDGATTGGPAGGRAMSAAATFQHAQLPAHLVQRKAKDREFLEYLFTPKRIPDFRVPVSINAELRGYQQAGVNWLWFLNKYKLHGILCDDMGLGKTLQTICLLAGAQHELQQAQAAGHLASLVICPPTLTGHWVYEVRKFLPGGFLRALHYVGQPADRERLRRQLGAYNLVVASYDIVRKDIEWFGAQQWDYVVLDEGHIIKNGKTKSSKAIKQLVANHRLILSGTPIQNNVLELWSLFDFLMPGFLGTEKQFVARFSRPILASRDARSSARDQEAGVLAMESLHRQVLPFLLRRVKEDVLTDLPPKITQDLLCELSPLQERLYEDFSRTHQMHAEIKECLASIEQQQQTAIGGAAATTAVAGKKTHVFQALRYLQNVCNHPKLVLTAQHPECNRIARELQRSGSSLDDIEHSAKLPALKQLLLDCGIGTGAEDVSVNQHRALIFCQLKAMLDIVEHDLLRRHLPAVSYLRLDGSVPPASRHSIVTKFNSDPSIDVLLLTTQVGGLGLNLTGADTVIFVEHDWNPMKDLQAMDRAHRIGQRKVVNVYRLITRKSLEEKIMGLQKFKLITANTIVTDENAAMETMQTDQLFDLFNLSDGQSQSPTAAQLQPQQPHGENNGTAPAPGDGSAAGPASTAAVTMKQALETLPELWEDQQYEEEYDMSQFLLSMK